MSVVKTLSIIFIVPCLLGIFTYKYLGAPVPEGYSPETTKELDIFMRLFKGSQIGARIAESVGIGSFGPNLRNALEFLASLAGEAPDPSIKETDLVFDGVLVRVYEPADRKDGDVLPGFVFYHGGGWVISTVESYNPLARKLCKQTNTVVVSVEYRLAPEHVFPIPVQDCVTATKYFLTNAARFNVDPTRVAIGGDSAGGNLAAVVALHLRDEAFEPSVKLQVLIYPVTQGVDLNLPSHKASRSKAGLEPGIMASFITLYLEGTEERQSVVEKNEHVSSAARKNGFPFLDVTKLPSKYLVGYKSPTLGVGDETVWNEMKDKLLNPYFSPLAAPRLDNLPQAYVFTAEHDALRDEGILYALRMQEHGVKVTHHHSDIGYHGVFSSPAPEAEQMFRVMTQFVVDNL